MPGDDSFLDDPRRESSKPRQGKAGLVDKRGPRLATESGSLALFPISLCCMYATMQQFSPRKAAEFIVNCLIPPFLHSSALPPTGRILKAGRSPLFPRSGRQIARQRRSLRNGTRGGSRRSARSCTTARATWVQIHRQAAGSRN